jgi:hypothetical protein
MIYFTVDPKSAGFDDSPLIDGVQPTAGANVGSGMMSKVDIALVSSNTTWTVTCTTAVIPGDEIWSVENDLTKAAYSDAESGVYYTSDLGEIGFRIFTAGTDFEVGDSFTFTTENTAVVGGVVYAAPGEFAAAPSVYNDPNGGGVLVVYSGEDDQFSELNLFYYIFGYNGAVLAGPTMISDVDGISNSVTWRRHGKGSMRNNKVYATWGQGFVDNSKAPLGESVMLGIDDYPLPKPAITEVSPATAVEGVETIITITGTDFDASAIAYIGEIELLNVTIDSATSITATVLDTQALGAYPVRVVNPDTLYGILVDAFTVVEPEVTDDDDDVTDDDDDDSVDDDDSDDDDDTAPSIDTDEDDEDSSGCCG